MLMVMHMFDTGDSATYKKAKVVYGHRVLTACTDPSSYTVRGFEQGRSHAVLKFTHSKEETIIQ